MSAASATTSTASASATASAAPATASTAPASAVPSSSSQMRFYVHTAHGQLEGGASSSALSASIAADVAGLPDHTFVYVMPATFRAQRWESSSASTSAASTDQDVRVDDMIRAFLADYERVHGIRIIVHPTIDRPIRALNGAALALDSVLALHLKDRGDVFIWAKRAPATSAPSAAATGAPAASAKSSATTAKPSTATTTTTTTTTARSSATPSRSTAPASRASSSSSSFNPQETVLFHNIEHANRLIGRSQLRSAMRVLQDQLDHVPDPPQTPSQRQVLLACLRGMAQIFYDSNHFDKARVFAERAVANLEAKMSTLSKADKLAAAPELALDLQMLAESCLALRLYDEAELAAEKGVALLSDHPDKAQHLELLYDLDVLVARVLLAADPALNRARAISILERLIHDQNKQHSAALTHYAQLAVEVGRGIETIPYLLRAIVQAEGTPSTTNQFKLASKRLLQSLFADMLAKPGGVEELLKNMSTAADSPSALSFLANIAKDQGSIKAAVELFKRASARSVGTEENIGVTLSLAHALEVAYDYQQAFDVIKAFLKTCPVTHVGRLRVADFAAVLSHVTSLNDVSLRSGTAYGCGNWNPFPPLANEGACVVTVPNATASEPVKYDKLPYPLPQLNVLAILFTCVKVMFVQGALQPLPRLIEMLEPIRQDKELHLTVIRNEQAYYSTLAHVCKYVPFPIAPTILAATQKHIYMCGDSHSLAPAWQTITIKGEPYLLVPRLSTGTKCWHLRPNCRFYPHANFNNAVQAIPNRSTVVFCLGEIDCREGLLVAVEKMRYSTIEEGMQLAIDVYIRKLEALVSKNKLKVFVHPIVPVLDLTRKTVTTFTTMLRDRLAASPTLTYLDFFDRLLTPDCQHLRTEYNLDNTHLHPAYVRLLEAELNAKWSA